MAMRPLNAAQERLWRSLTRLMIVLPRALDEDLSAKTDLSLTSYIVLSKLSEAPGRQLRMSHLAERAALSPSRITRVVQGLEGRGLVQRSISQQDQRASLANLTDAGLDRLEAAWPNHLEAVRNLAINHVRRSEIAELTQVIERILAAIGDDR